MSVSLTIVYLYKIQEKNNFAILACLPQYTRVLKFQFRMLFDQELYTGIGFSFTFNSDNATICPNNNNLWPAYYAAFNLVFLN